MDNQHQKWVTLSYAAVAALFSFIVFVFAQKIAGTYDLEARIRGIDMLIRLGSLGLGAILFLILNRHQRINQFMGEVMVELFRVTWPAQRETASATGVVMIMVLLSGLFLGFLDYFWTLLLKWVL